ncbi:MAG TPA: zinc-dependent metalloprotease [Planctomycetota bacterium]|nr:zinc-dependent metalloprotease [Planctomycetota bacterium]
MVRIVAALPLLTLGVLALPACSSTPKAAEGTPAPAETGATAKAEPAKTETAKSEGEAAAAAAPAAGAATAKHEEGGDDAAKKAKEKEDKEKKEKEEAKKKYDELTEKLTKEDGFFTIWHDGEKIYLELTKNDYGRPFLYAGALGSGAGSGAIYRGAMLSDNDFVLRLERRGDKKVILVAENNRYLDGGDAAEEKLLQESTSESIIQVFDVAVELKDDGKLLINLGDWLNNDPLQVAAGLGKYGINKDLSQVKKVQDFPRNVEIDQEVVLLGQRGAGGNLTLADSRGYNLKVHHSLCALPDDGYKPRLYDQRVGYFFTERKDLLDLKSKDPVKRYISRWRLQKKDPTAEVSDPVQPITYWIENSTPKEWRDAVKKAIEMWEPAFRKAGFSNAIVAKQMPEDADWDPADIRYSVVRWSNDENVGFAIGPSRVDPRTGEIFDADITMQANFVAIYRQRFETYVNDLAAMSKEDLLAQTRKRIACTPPDDFDGGHTCKLAGDEMAAQVAEAAAAGALLDDNFDTEKFLSSMLSEVVAHEVGHTLGLRHNFKASTWRTLADMSDVSLTAQTGIVGSVMDYNAINISAPGVKQGEYFTSAVGPYDVWAIQYGYSEFGSNEETALKAIAARSQEPGLDYGTDEDMFMGDPYAQTWDLGTDPVAFAKDQIKLAEAGFAKLSDKGAKKGEGYNEYTRFYGMFAGLYSRNLFGLDRFLWGVNTNRDVVGQDSGRKPIVFVDPAVQREALDILCTKGLQWKGGIPDDQRLLLAGKKYGSFGSWFDMWTFDPLPRIVNNTRYAALAPLTDNEVMERLGTSSHLAGNGAMSPQEVADKVFGTVWASDTPDEHDRWTQSDYLDITLRNLRMETTPDVTALNASLLTRVDQKCDTYAKSSDKAVANHGAWLKDRIKRWRERQVTEQP